jgi:enoyl-CoA hydratase/carnithine racemase
MNKIEVKEHICFITLDNQPHNLLHRPEFIEPEILSKTINKNDCKAIIISGAGRHFSAGADINELKKLIVDDILEEEIVKGVELLKTIKSFNLPIISCVEGSCLGGGLEIALSSDIKIASTKALFAFPEANLDLIPGLGGILNLSRITGKSTAIQMALKGDIVNAKDAFSLNIVDYLVEPKTTLEEGIKIAQSITSGRSLDVIKAVVEAVRNSELLGYEEALEQETKLFCKLARKIKNA